MYCGDTARVSVSIGAAQAVTIASAAKIINFVTDVAP
jgi:hypothetical protein